MSGEVFGQENNSPVKSTVALLTLRYLVASAKSMDFQSSRYCKCRGDHLVLEGLALLLLR